MDPQTTRSVFLVEVENGMFAFLPSPNRGCSDAFCLFRLFLLCCRARDVSKQLTDAELNLFELAGFVSEYGGFFVFHVGGGFFHLLAQV